ncbi:MULTISPECIES: hypothetical protein [unclassified Methylophaga]|uniref:hypothetical protein n=1 Tax=unclassified Methylophaga TaxID=2629249 RepID=UPI000C906E0E|nr:MULTISPECIES: hypothetical protein [unclassified Methylophaga]MBN45580.1 hypothetical protein [Methylophaga sp.]
MSFIKNLFLPAFTASLLTGLMVFIPSQHSYADVSVNVQLGQNMHNRPHHGISGNRHYRSPSIGITGHRSFGLDPRLNHFKQPRYKPYYRHYDTTRPRHRTGYYGFRGNSITLITPIVYSQNYQNADPIRRYTANSSRPLSTAASISNYSNLDGWEALSRYESTTAINAFKAQSSKNPKASLPKIGFALATALQGETDKAFWALNLALIADTSDLRYFSADPGLQLVIDDLLENYHNKPLMTATLLYLKQDYRSARTLIKTALNECDNCSATRNMQRLIQQRLNG